MAAWQDSRAAPLDAGWGSAHLAAGRGGWRKAGADVLGGRWGSGVLEGGAWGLPLPQQHSDQPYSLGSASSTLAKIVVPIGKVCWQEGWRAVLRLQALAVHK